MESKNELTASAVTGAATGAMAAVSIVIPTRNRPTLFREALQSAIDQTAIRCELVVSDNSDPQHWDAMDETVKSVGDKWVVLVRPPRPLSMPENWEFGVRHATGEFITILCDDDALAPGAMSIAVHALARSSMPFVTWNVGWYTHDTWPDEARRNSVEFRCMYSRKETIRNSLADLKDLYRSRYDVCHPKMQNTLCRRELLEEVARRQGRLFERTCPDYGSAAALLALTDNYAFLNWPLALAGASGESIGASTLRGLKGPAEEFAREFGGQRILENVPLQSVLTYNYVTDTLVRVKQNLGDALQTDVSWPDYFIACCYQLRVFRSFGTDVAAAEKEVRDVLTTQPLDLQEQVRAAVNAWDSPPPVVSRARRLAYCAKQALLSAVRGQPRSGSTDPKTMVTWPIVLHGHEAGFSGISACARQLDAMVSSHGLLMSGEGAGATPGLAPEPSPAPS